MKILLAVAALCLAGKVEGVINGKAAETMDAGGYTYVRVAQGAVSTWVAVPQMKVKVGDAVSFKDGMVMNRFKSPSLKRTFDEIVFSEGPAGKSGPKMGTPAAIKDAAAKAEKASGADGSTVADVYARRAELTGKKASVRGKVVKVNRGIMGRNWVHLQDGTGDAKAGTFDLLVTTDQDAKVGETVVASGTVAKDQDFGMGYKYAVMLEKASLGR